MLRLRGDVGQGNQMVILKLSMLIRKALQDMNGPDLHVCITVGETGLRTVHISFDASKFPYQINCGIPENHVSFAGTSLISVPEAELDAARKVADYLYSKFGVCFADLSYEKLHIVERKITVAEASINEAFNNLNNILGNWKTSFGIMLNTQKAMSLGGNPFQIAVCEDLINLKCVAEACFQHISSEMKCANTEHAACWIGSQNNISEDVIIIKISERDIINNILASLGFKNANFTNTLEDNFCFKGSCKINVNDTCTSRTTGKTTITGDVKKSAYEAECNAAAKAIAFLESALSIKVVDLNYYSLLEKQALLDRLLNVNKKYESIQNLVVSEWMSMIVQLKGLVNSKIEACTQPDVNVAEALSTEACELMNDMVGDINMLFDLSTIDLCQDSC